MAPLPSLTLAQIQAWDTDHLDAAAAHWIATANRWRDGFTAVSSGISRPGGTTWEGAAAEAASARTERDRVQVLGLVDGFVVACGAGAEILDDPELQRLWAALV